ncbi:hypothetical protein BY458DRAFT_534185 [Sporodiniella umbellata]|nr:hypothetical protein BY458DRAFT_534185 [Sporodiniella umbellata]
MPENVPFFVFCLQIVRRLGQLVKNLIRGLAVIFVWLVVLPNFTLWTWRFYFWSGVHIGFNTTQLPKEAEEEHGNSSPFKGFLRDCLEGQIIAAFVVIMFLAAYLFREWVMQNLPAAAEEEEEPAVVIEERNEARVAQERAAIDTLYNALQAMNPPERQEDIEENQDPDRVWPTPQPAPFRPAEAEQDGEDYHGQLFAEAAQGRAEPIAEEQEEAFRILNQEMERRRGELGVRRERRPAQAVRVEENEEVFEVADDMNGVFEAIGMRGNPWMLVQNSVLMSLMISLCLGLAVWIPYVAGRLLIMVRPISFIETPIFFLRFVTDPLVDFVLDICLPRLGMMAYEYWYRWAPVSASIALDGFLDQLKVEPSHAATQEPAGWIAWGALETPLEEFSQRALQRWHQFALGHTAMDRSVCIAVGYFLFICLGSWYLASSRRRQSPVQDAIRQQGIFLKVLFFIVIELVVFPTVCGFLLDFATLPLFVNASIGSRYAFHVKSPYSSYFLHWFLGTGVLFYFAIFITVSREIIRPGVMWFVRDPNDPQFHPVQEMVERPFPNLLYKITQSAIMYSTMLVFGVGTVTYTLGLTGAVFPLRLPFSRPLSTLAVDLLMIQFLLPPLVRFLQPRENGKQALTLWWHWACGLLRMTHFMFNERRPDEEGHHVRKTWRATFLRQTAPIPLEAITHEQDDVVFERDGQWVRVPRYDSVPVDPKRRMLVPVDPVTFEAIDPEERARGHPATVDTGDESQSTTVVYIPPWFKLRSLVFLVFMWLFISLAVCSVTVLPLLLGRYVFKAYLAPQADIVNDLYSFTLGLYMLVGLGIGGHWMYRIYLTRNENSIRKQLTSYGYKVGRCVYLLSAFAVVMPVLVGVAVDLFVYMPIRTHYSQEGIVIHLSQNWAFGIVYMSLVYYGVQLLPAHYRVRTYLDSVFGNNMIQADLNSITRKVIVPVTLVATGCIVLPGALAWVVWQMIDGHDASLQLLVTRYTYPALFGSLVTLLLCFVSKELFKIWLKAVRDDTYKIREALHNFEQT